MNSFFARHRIAIICLVLAVITTALYWPVTHHQFFNIDDPRFISQNEHVQPGLTWAGVKWAFSTLYTENWQPLTWLSHMLDCQLFGLNAGGHHFTSMLFHLANSLLLFLWLYNLTQAAWRSAFVAAFFAWHPLHVESVAWACERKDMLSTFFWMLALMTYTSYAQGSHASGQPQAKSRRWLFYVLTLVFFTCGLMSKPMVVTLPCVLLLLDIWPLDRFGLSSSTNSQPDGSVTRKITWAIAEKVPFILMTGVISVATLIAQRAGGALSSLTGMPLPMRVANSLINYGTYLGQTFWPVDLAYFYPYVHNRPIAQVVGVAALLVILTVWFAMRVRKEPYLLVGWLWFLGTLVPTIGLVHVGIQSRADRYMYIPSIGLFIVLVWGACRLFEQLPDLKRVLPILGGGALAACVAVTSIQLGYWQDSVTLSEHAVDVTRNNYVAYESLGRALYSLGRKDLALACYSKSVEIEPEFPQSQFNLALALREHGQISMAVEHFAAAVKLVPSRYETRAALAETLMMMGNDKLTEAEDQFSEALRLEPDSADAHRNLAVAYARQGNLTNALPHFEEAVRLNPANVDSRFGFGLALLDTHQPAAAAAQFTEEIKLAPNDTKAHYRLAQALQQQNQLPAAVAEYQAALRLAPNFPEATTALNQILATHPELKASEPLDIAH